MVAAYRGVNTDGTEFPGSRYQKIGVDFAKAAGFLGVYSIYEPRRSWRARRLAGREVIVVLIARPVILADTTLHENTGQ